MKYHPACEVSCLTQSSEMLFQQSSSRGSSNLQSGYCSWDGDWEGGWWRELEEEEEEEVKDHEEGEETRASTFTPHHTELKCLLRYAWRSHTHTPSGRTRATLLLLLRLVPAYHSTDAYKVILTARRWTLGISVAIRAVTRAGVLDWIPSRLPAERWLQLVM